MKMTRITTTINHHFNNCSSKHEQNFFTGAICLTLVTTGLWYTVEGTLKTIPCYHPIWDAEWPIIHQASFSKLGLVSALCPLIRSVRCRQKRLIVLSICLRLSRPRHFHGDDIDNWRTMETPLVVLGGPSHSRGGILRTGKSPCLIWPVEN